MKKIKIRDNPLGFLIMVLLATGLFVWACNSDPAVQRENRLDLNPYPTSAPATPKSLASGTEGDQLELNGTVVLVGRIWASDQSNKILGDRTCAPVVYRNMSDEPIRVSPLDWKLTTPAGLTLDATFGGAAKMLPFGEIQPRGATEGSVCFDVPHENRGLWTLKYKPSIWSDGELTWTNQ